MITTIRDQFPIFKKHPDLVFLDSAASAQKPHCVIERLSQFYSEEYANIHRGLYHLSEQATHSYERVRETVRSFMNANETAEIVFTSGTTEAVNLLASSLGQNLSEGDEILLSVTEHHSNIVPWQFLVKAKGVVLKTFELDESLSFDEELFQRQLTAKTQIVAIPHVSNVLGLEFPVKKITEMAHEVGAVVVVDGAQGIVHQKVDVQELGCDFYSFSGHKLYGPTGVGVLYGRKESFENLPPYQGGGEMIRSVSFEQSEYQDLPARFEAGTPSIADVIALETAIQFVEQLGPETRIDHERELMNYAESVLAGLSRVSFLRKPSESCGVVPLVIEGAHSNDMAMLLSEQNIAVRSGHHCAEPLHHYLGVKSTLRASMALYTTRQDWDRLAEGLEKGLRIL